MTNSQYFNRYDARNVSLRRKVKEGERRVAIDVRVSTQHEMQINALENQKQWALDLARDHKIDKDIRKVQSRNEKLLDFLEEGLIDKDTYIKRKEKNDKEIQQKEELKKCIIEEQMEEVQKEEVIASVKKFIDEALKFPKIHNVKVAVPDALIDTYVNSIKVCAGGIFEYNIKINPNAEVDVPVVPYDIFNPQIHSAYNILDNSKATLIAEFTINYEEAKAYANSLGRKVRRVHFSEDVTIRIFTNL